METFQADLDQKKIDSSCRMAVLSTLKKGELIKRKPDSKTVYMKSHYNRREKAFVCVDWSDVNRWIMIKANKPVFFGFTF